LVNEKLSQRVRELLKKNNESKDEFDSIVQDREGIILQLKEKNQELCFTISDFESNLSSQNDSLKYKDQEITHLNYSLSHEKEAVNQSFT